MSARGWTTEDQKAYLRSQIPAFLDAQQGIPKQDSLNRFHKNVFETFNRLWPLEPGDDAGMDDRRKQLYHWYYWHARVKGVRQSASGSALGKKLARKIVDIQGNQSGHVQPIQLYHSLKKEQLRPLVQEQMREDGVTSQREKMVITRKILREWWENEEDRVIDEVTEACRQRNRDNSHAVNRLQDPATPRNPNEIKNALAGLPPLIHSVIGQLSEETGWVFFISAAGPHPEAQGNIYMQNFYLGPKNALGQDFKESYPGFDEHFRKPFSNHVSDCFLPAAQDVRLSRSLYPERKTTTGGKREIPSRKADLTSRTNRKRPRPMQLIGSEDDGSDGDTDGSDNYHPSPTGESASESSGSEDAGLFEGNQPGNVGGRRQPVESDIGDASDEIEGLAVSELSRTLVRPPRDRDHAWDGNAGLQTPQRRPQTADTFSNPTDHLPPPSPDRRDTFTPRLRPASSLRQSNPRHPHPRPGQIHTPQLSPNVRHPLPVADTVDNDYTMPGAVISTPLATSSARQMPDVDDGASTSNNSPRGSQASPSVRNRNLERQRQILLARSRNRRTLTPFSPVPRRSSVSRSPRGAGPVAPAEEETSGNRRSGRKPQWKLNLNGEYSYRPKSPRKRRR